jgi:hypothetical protein
MWSWTDIPRGVAMSMMALVIRMSACDGVGSPEGWLCTNQPRREFPLFFRRISDFQD